MKFRNVWGAVAGAAALLGSQHNGSAINITVDQVLADAPAGLAATVTMVANGNHLIITLANTSVPGSASGANGLLTGIGFTLPGGYSINSGSVAVNTANGSIVVGSAFAGTDISGEWGYGNSLSGHFNDAGLTTINRQVATMDADTAFKFSATSIDPPAALSGPDWGLVRNGGSPGGLPAVQNSVIIDLLLSQSAGTTTAETDAFVNAINAGTVAAVFGSPTIPDGGSTLILLGVSLGAVAGLARLRKFSNR